MGQPAGIRRWKVAREVRKLAEGMEKAAARSGLEKLAKRIDRCGAKIAVLRCAGCGEVVVGSGTFSTVTERCKSRTCPICGRTRALAAERLLEDAARAVGDDDEHKGWEWQYLVLTTKYDPCDPAEVAWPALRDRAMRVTALTRKVWEKLLKVPGAGMMRTTEVGFSGMVHANLLYYGPKVNRMAVEDLAKKLEPIAGSVWSQRICDGQEGARTPEQVGRRAKYIAKGVSESRAAFDEGYLAGDASVEGGTMDPRLAAAWEVGTRRLHLTKLYGFLRGLRKDGYDEDGGYDEGAVSADQTGPTNWKTMACLCCGLVGEFGYDLMDTEQYLLECHSAGLAGMWRSNWRNPHKGKKRKKRGPDDPGPRSKQYRTPRAFRGTPRNPVAPGTRF